jgi:hypothetical protein
LPNKFTGGSMDGVDGGSGDGGGSMDEGANVVDV